MRTTLSLLLVTGITAAVPAQDVQEATTSQDIEKVLTRFKAIQEAQKQKNTAMMKGEMRLRGAQNRDEQLKLRAEVMDALDKHQAVIDNRIAAFRTAFRNVSWGSFDVKKHRQVLETGLMTVGQHALETDPETSVKAFEALLSRLPTSPASRMVIAYFLAPAYAASNKLAEGIQRFTELVGTARSDPDRRMTLIALGDLWAASRHFGDAKASWQKAVHNLNEDSLGPRDPLLGVKRAGDLRLELVGKAAPEMDSKDWIGGAPTPLSALKGRVLIVSFWATWYPPCRAVMPGLSRLYADLQEDGLKILGVTQYYNRGYMPANPGQIRSGGKRVDGISKTAFRKHVQDFKKNSRIIYPFVIGTRLDFERYGARSIPTVVVVDRQGQVVMVGTGGACEPLIRAATKAAMKAK